MASLMNVRLERDGTMTIRLYMLRVTGISLAISIFIVKGGFRQRRRDNASIGVQHGGHAVDAHFP